MIPCSRPKLADFYTLPQSILLENHTLHSGTCLYSPYMTVIPPAYGHQWKRRQKTFLPLFQIAQLLVERRPRPNSERDVLTGKFHTASPFSFLT